MEIESSNFLVASSSSSSSSSSSTTIQQWKYDVFLSFRGEDTRDNFTSHLHAALSRKGIKTFIDNELKKGEDISPALLKVIEESKIVVIILSKDYASSAWCLKELEHIIKCMESMGQTVLPIFYQVNPSDIAKQSGIVAESFARHEKVYGENSERVRRWKDAMTKVANLSGWDSKVTKPESQLVNEIVKFVLRKLEKTWTSGLEGLVGMHSRSKQVKQLLSIGTLDVRIIGIWGMGGIGKTTIARAVFRQIACNFEACCFLENVREESENFGLIQLGEKLLSRILEEKDIKISTHGVGPYFNNLLHQKKVLIVLDDVNKYAQLEFLVGDRCWFGPGSRIILTSRDKQVFGKWVDKVYKVKKLNSDKALQLFVSHAFKKDDPPRDQLDMSKLVIEYANGIPLALKVLGASLFGKSQKEWKSALNKLERVPNGEINNVLKISFDGLDEEEQKIFLHIACFFKGKDRESVTQILDSCAFSTDIGISTLLDKSLISILRENKLKIHDLLQEMGKAIARRESEDPGKRKRLCDQQDVYQVLTKNRGTEVVEGIILDVSKIGDTELHPSVFTRMPNLKFLKFYTYNKSECSEEEPKLHFSKGIESLPNELRYFYWHGYSLKRLPANFHPVDLVELNMPYSNMKRLWKRSKHLEKLKKIDLSYSRRLVKFPDPTMTPNLMRINLTGCTSLLKVPSTVSGLSNLTELSLAGCRNIESIPSVINLNSLETLNLLGCSKLETFPAISRNINKLILDQTAIKEVPSSVDNLSRLVELSLRECAKLEVLPCTICKLKSLDILDLHGCSNLKNFPNILEVMDNLWYLNLDKTALEELPSSIDNLKGLTLLLMYNCKNLSYLPESFSNLRALDQFELTGCSKLGKLPSNLNLQDLKVVGNKGRKSIGLSLPPLLGMSGLSYLVLEDCNLSSLPEDLGCLSTLVSLDLRKNNFETIPASIKQLSHLERLEVRYCWKLQSLPELPPRLNFIDARDCTSLRTVSSLSQLFRLEPHHHPEIFREEFFMFYNCFQLCENAWSNVSANALSRIQRFAKVQGINAPNFVRIYYPGSEIPECFAYKRIGASITIQMPPYSPNNIFLGFALCVVVSFGDNRESYFSVEIKGHFKNGFGGSYDFIRVFPASSSRCSYTQLPGHARSEHVLLGYYDGLHRTAEGCDWAGDRWYDEVSFEFKLYCEDPHGRIPFRECFKVTKCAVYPLYAQDKECSRLETPTEVATWRGRMMNILKEDTQNKRCSEAIGSLDDDGCEEKPLPKRLKQN